MLVKFDGVITLSESVPVVTSALVASSTIPSAAVVACERVSCLPSNVVCKFVTALIACV